MPCCLVSRAARPPWRLSDESERVVGGKRLPLGVKADHLSFNRRFDVSIGICGLLRMPDVATGSRKLTGTTHRRNPVRPMFAGVAPVTAHLPTPPTGQAVYQPAPRSLSLGHASLIVNVRRRQVPEDVLGAPPPSVPPPYY